jgi:hypothetical protein
MVPALMRTEEVLMNDGSLDEIGSLEYYMKFCRDKYPPSC